MKSLLSFSKNIISIDLGSYETKIVQGKQSKVGIQINKAFSFNTPRFSYDNGYIRDFDKLINATKEEFKKNNLSLGSCHISIKSTAIITREILFPPLSDSEIEGLLKYQLPEYLPMDESKYVIQHKIIGKVIEEDKDKVNILVVAIPKEIVDMHYGFAKAIGLRPSVLDHQTNCFCKLMDFISPLEYIEKNKDKTTVGIDLGYSSTNITIIKNNKLQTSRTIDLGGIHLDNNAVALIALTTDELMTKKRDIVDVSSIDEGYSDDNRYVNIVKTSIEGIMDRAEKVFKYFMAKEVDNEIHEILLYGGLSQIQGIDKLFYNYFNIPTIVIDDIDRVRIQSDANKYINCIAALLRDDEV